MWLQILIDMQGMTGDLVVLEACLRMIGKVDIRDLALDTQVYIMLQIAININNSSSNSSSSSSGSM